MAGALAALPVVVSCAAGCCELQAAAAGAAGRAKCCRLLVARLNMTGESAAGRHSFLQSAACDASQLRQPSCGLADDGGLSTPQPAHLPRRRWQLARLAGPPAPCRGQGKHPGCWMLLQAPKHCHSSSAQHSTIQTAAGCIPRPHQTKTAPSRWRSGWRRKSAP